MSKIKLNQAMLRDEREARGLTKLQMVDVLGLDGAHAEQILTDFEAGFRQPKSSALRVYESLNRQRWGASHLLALPVWTMSKDCTVIHHNEWPRFVGRALREETHPQQWQFKKAGIPTFVLNGAGGFHQLVCSLSDHVPDDLDIEELFAEAVRLVESSLKELM